jgi:protein-S-isoprenylcysteine O-methyltransferase Ste14
MVRQGRWLFRWRSFLPLLLLPFAVGPLRQSDWMSEALGPRLASLWDYFCLLLAVTGLGIRIFTVGCVPAGTSRRSTREQSAASLNISGMYSLMRHPLYFGNFIIFIAFVLMLKNIFFTLLSGLVYCLYYERIMLAEEEFLKRHHGQSYCDWAALTPAFIPRLRGWIRPALPFSWRSALRREFHSVLLIGTIFLLIEIFRTPMGEIDTLIERLREKPFWLALFVFSAAFYLVVLIIKKWSRWLIVKGR